MPLEGADFLWRAPGADSPHENVSPNLNEPNEPASLESIAEKLTLPSRWTRLHVPDFDGVLCATTTVTRNPFVVTHEKVLLFTTDDRKRVFARPFFHGKEGQEGEVKSMVEARKFLHQTAISILCTGAMDRQQYISDFSEHLTERLKASLLIVQGAACLACRFLRKGLQRRRMMHDLIEIMTSRFATKALRPGSVAEDQLLSFLTYLTEWERHAAGQGGFLSTSTAVGLRVTVSSVISVLDYLPNCVGYKYLMTSKLGQDPIENLFGIVSQPSGCNSHPTPQQFLITVSCLSFYGLAKSVSNGNAEPGVLTSLLEPDGAGHSK
ncbi:hypothetical protein HPB50_021872 [Hyalomma asiaticum]|uniref:Uncharacterized protein n=1 Tax=Hyalomma asiaticum TaxID=266040 RepID=A0ACB7SX67_HYAAI|nr:hypothetical protein HPB50_021872 [Hyalomma asiaticum]